MDKHLFITLDQFEEAKKYWLGKLSGKLEDVRVPMDFPGTVGYDSAVYKLTFNSRVTEELVRISKDNSLSLFILLLTFYKILIFKYTGQRDIIVASPVYTESNRKFNQYVAFRDILQPSMTFRDLLMMVRQTVVEGYKNEHHPFSSIIDSLAKGVKQGQEQWSIFTRHALLLENIHKKQNESIAEMTTNLKNDMILSTRRNDHRLEGDLIYNSKLFKQGTIKGLFDCYFRILHQVLSNLDIRISDIQLMTEEQKRGILFDLNNTGKDYPGPATIHGLFEQQVERTPDNRAVCSTIEVQNIYDRLKPEQIAIEMSFEELNQRVNQLAARLREKGVRPNTLVGMMMRHPLELTVALLGILKAGGAFLPIDPGYPQKMKAFILEESQPAVIVTESALVETVETIPFTQPSPIVVVIDDEPSQDYPLSNPESINQPTDLAYAIYTSGTTGKSKGVLIEHRGLVNYTKWRIETYLYTQTDVTLQLLSYCFDGFGSNFYSSLLSGGSLFIVPDSKKVDFDYIKEIIAEYRVTNTSLVPGIYNVLLDTAGKEALESLRFVVLAGEKSGPELIRKSREKASQAQLINEYGPTETTVAAVVCQNINEDTTAVIGTPISNTRVYILDSLLEPVPVNAAGELCISGIGTARGYLNSPELTAGKFDPDFQDDQDDQEKKEKAECFHHSSLYRTGDLARWLPDGNIEFLGRIDHQVKIRGLRIELEAIENQLRKHDDIKDAVVVVMVNEATGDNYLCGYVVFSPTDSSKPDTFRTSELREYLAAEIPDFMIPTFFVSLPEIPLTPNGKVDRKALPLPETRETGETYVPPRNDVEERLVEIWSEVLGIEKETIGIDTNFFERGGHSIKATIMESRIHKEFNVKIPMEDIFNSPTIRELSTYINGTPKDTFDSIEPAKKKPYYVLSSAQMRMYILQQMKADSTAYNMPKIIRLEGNPSRERLENTFVQLIQRHESLRTSFEIIKGQLVQRIHDDASFKIEYYDLTAKTREETRRNEENHHSSFIIHHFICPFNLSRAPLLRVGFSTISKEEHLLLVDMHHIVSDGISHHILVQDFMTLYSGQELPPLRLQYKDYSEWQNAFFHSDSFLKQENFWMETLKGDIPVLEMPLDFERPERQSFEGERVAFTIPAETVGKLNSLVQEYSVTLNMIIVSLYVLLLNQSTGQTDIILGSLVAGRNHADLEKIIGMFVNFLPLRFHIHPDESFLEFLERTRKTVLEAYKNQDYPFEKLIDRLNIPIELSRNPLFDTMVVFHNQADPLGDASVLPMNAPSPVEVDELKAAPYEFEAGTSTLDIKLDVFPDPSGQLKCYFQYDTRLFKRETIDRLITQFLTLIHHVIDAPEKKLQLSLPSPLLRLVVSATFTAEPVEHVIKWWAKQFDLTIDVVFAPYNQVFQELLKETGVLSTNPGINLLLIRFEDWIRTRSSRQSDEETCQLLEQQWSQWISIFKTKTKAKTKPVPYFVGLFPVSTHLSLSPTVIHLLEELNARWEKTIKTLDHVYIIDCRQLADLYGIRDIFDPVADREGHLPFTQPFYAALGTFIARKIGAFKNQPFKVIALDCDNTLWRGICGEDGAAGVSIDGPYLQLQTFMLHMYHQGMLLTLCSKNNEADVWDVFEKNPHMLLKKEHFVHWKINWNPKSSNLKELAHELNVGIDSFIYIDDNPVECSEVLTNCPEALTLNLPAEPAHIPNFLKHIWAFDKIVVTPEDKSRSRLYQAEKKRSESRKESVSLTDFLSRLELKISMNPMKPSQVARVSQLTRRTNQFNLSTIRRDEEKIRALTADPEAGIQCWVIEVSDRFGDYGLVGVVITKEQGECLFIDTLLLSCRVLGRGVEDAILKGLGTHCQSRHLKTLTADYYPTARNKPILDFLQQRWKQQEQQQGYTRYTLPIKNIEEIPTFFDFYYCTTFNKEKPQDTHAIDAAGETIIPTLPAHQSPSEQAQGNALLTEHQWQVTMDNVNRDNLGHKNLLLPLVYHTGETLMDLTLKINKAQQKTISRISQAPYQAPQDEEQEKLVHIWSDILGVEKNRIGIDTRFFDLGGSSLGIILMVSEIYKTFQVEISVMQVFADARIKAISAIIKEKSKGILTKEHPESPVLLLNEPKPRHLFFFPPLIGYGIGYKELSTFIEDYSVYAFNYIEENDKLKKYMDVITRIQEKGPYLLFGYSSGGNLAFEVAREMEAEGYEVSDIIMMDAFFKDIKFFHSSGEENNRFHHAVEAAVTSMGIAFLKEEIVNKTKRYSHYYWNLINQGMVQANIHSIEAEDKKEREARIRAAEKGSSQKGNPAFPGWEKHTLNKCIVYQGSGSHIEMFAPPFLEKNATLINNILKKLH